MSAAEKLEFSIVPGDWFRQELLFPVFGISTEAARKYRAGGQWLEGRHWRKDPASRSAYNRAAIAARRGGSAGRTRCRQGSRLTASNRASASWRTGSA